MRFLSGWGWALLQLSFTAGLQRMLQWLWEHLAAYLPGFPEGLVHSRILPHTGPGMGEYHLPGTQLGSGHFPL